MTTPFLITGQGRSGTLFLSRVLNLSPTWTVEHEWPNDYGYYRNTADDFAGSARARFVGNYGAVNSMLRRVAPYFQGVNVVVILRDPRDIVTSVHNARGRERAQFAETAREVIPGLCDVMALVKMGYLTFRLEDIVTDIEALRILAGVVGVTDIPWAQVEIGKKENASPLGSLGRWEAWDVREHEQAEYLLGWFMKEFGYAW